MRTVGIDIGKNCFHVAICDERGKVVERARLTRKGLAEFITRQPQSLIGMESCAGSQPLARACEQSGHTVRIIAAQFVKPYLRAQKNDYNDAEAIAEAVTRPRMRFVAVRSLEQQDLQILHRARDLLVREQTALINQIRGFLIEYGLAVAQGKSSLHRALPSILEDATNELTPRFRLLLSRLHERCQALAGTIDECDAEIARLATGNPICQRLMTIPGIGPKVATALYAAVGNAAHFNKSRDLAAWIGLVPRQDTTGGMTCGSIFGPADTLGQWPLGNRGDHEEVTIYGRTDGQDSARGGQDAGSRGGQEVWCQRGHDLRLAQALRAA